MALPVLTLYAFGRNFVANSKQMGKRSIIAGLILLTGHFLRAQDPQFTQFYAAPQYLNPAFAGSALAPRVTLNYRNQWPGLTDYVTTSLGVDHYISKYNSGIGLLIVNDNQGQGRIKSTDIGLQYSYQIQVSENTFVRLGLQGSYVNRSVNYYGLIYNYTGSGGSISPVTIDPATENAPNSKYLDFSTGGLVYSDWFWAGLAVSHINQPNQALFAGAPSRLPMKGSIHAGLRIPLDGITGLGDEMNREISISPAVLYKFQGKYDQLDVGAYFTYSPITFGLWYRGLPIKKYEQNINNHDAIAGLIGFRQDNFSIGYSYDATISTLGFGSGGSHEISMSYTFDRPEGGRNRIKRKDKRLPCPKF